MICLITGGARSGKSRYAQQLALQTSDRPLYIATAKAQHNDEEFMERILRHRQDRDERWASIEEPLYPSKLPLEHQAVVIDCVTLWLTNFFSLYKTDIEQSLAGLKREIEALSGRNNSFFIITNEIGMGVHAETAIGRKFTDLQGFANQYIAGKAQQVVLMVSGIPVTIKDNTA